MRISGWCPYCGHEELETAVWHKEGTWFVRCKHCRATGPSLAKTEEEAIRLFNVIYPTAEAGGLTLRRAVPRC